MTSSLVFHKREFHWLQRLAYNVSFSIRRPFLTGHCGEANKHLALLAYLEKTLVLDCLVTSYVTVKVP